MVIILQFASVLTQAQLCGMIDWLQLLFMQAKKVGHALLKPLQVSLGSGEAQQRDVMYLGRLLGDACLHD